MKLVKNYFMISVSVLIIVLSLFMVNGNYKKAYAAHADYFTQSTTRLNKYEVLINIVTKKEMNNFVASISYLTDNDSVIASDVQSGGHLNANQRYQFVFNLKEVMSESDCNKCTKYSYNFSYNEQKNRVINGADAGISLSGSTTNNKSAVENFLQNTFGDNYLVIVLAIAGGAIVLMFILMSVKKSKRK
ncbi:MAG: hypothetical protein SPL13_04320 [Clostridia bacterium]|nr:hypothetical protein [Clostridia bacterium]